ncbi:MAG: aminoacetone oxidase family FAD-binding enzyme [Phycisphaerales bacterium]|nr:aminoacetone oxidase family FAD-binding enzyme [Phycisphaerales bacterium]
MAAISAGRGWGRQEDRPGAGRRDVGARPRIIVLDGARSLGAKILVAGGGRCNVTHDVVDESAYAGSSRHAIKQVLRQFGVGQTVRFFEELGVNLKREETGKLFPVTDSARTVLQALLRAAGEAGVEIMHPWRVERVVGREAGGVSAPEQFVIEGPAGRCVAKRIVLATGGKSLPKTGSDGKGYDLVRSLGHSVTARVLPALVPLTLPNNHPLLGLSGLTFPATLELRSGTGKRLISFTDSTLLTHFGLSGPGVLDISRYFTDAQLDDPGVAISLNVLPEQSAKTVGAVLLSLGRVSVGRGLRERFALPDRLVDTLCRIAAVEPATLGHQLTRAQRLGLAGACTALELPITGDRGFGSAEVTAGGVPLSELSLRTLESRICPGLFLCGEVCDVDGRIGGYNFQWAWASGTVAGRGAAASV